MQITPVSNRCSSLINFTNKKSKPDNASRQNNSGDIFIPTRTYMAMIALKSLDASSKPKKPQNLYLSYDEQIKYKALVALEDFKTDMAFMKEAPDELKEKVPSFFRLNTEDVIDIVVKPRIINPKNHEEEQEYVMTRSIIDYLRKEKYGEMRKMAMQLNEAKSFELYSAIIAGFNRDAREVVNSISNQALNWIKPAILDNKDGTQTATYKNGPTHLVVTRKDNGDYISASLYSGNKISASVKFREDGSIMMFDSILPGKKGAISITSNKDNDEVTVEHRYPKRIITERYKKQEGNILEKIAMQAEYLK